MVQCFICEAAVGSEPRRCGRFMILFSGQVEIVLEKVNAEGLSPLILYIFIFYRCRDLGATIIKSVLNSPERYVRI